MDKIFKNPGGKSEHEFGRNKSLLPLLLLVLISFSYPSNPPVCGIGINAGGGELIGVHLKKDFGIFQCRIHSGISITYPYDEVTASSNGDTLNMRSMDQISGFNIRTFVFKYAYISTGISINNRRVETNIEKISNGTDLDISAHEVIEELPALVGFELNRIGRMSFYGEGGYVFQITDHGKEKYFSNNKYIARYKEPNGSITIGIGLTYNILLE